VGRQDQIRVAIENLPGDVFGRFATAVLRKEFYPDLNPTSDSHDLGEDAHTEESTVHLSGGERVAVLISKTATLTKVKSDCRRRRATGRPTAIVVFATAGNPRTDEREKWRRAIGNEFGWSLEVRALDWFVIAASEPRHDRLVDEYLQVPPPYGDAADHIDEEFTGRTRRVLRRAHLVIPGIPKSFPREEIGRVEDQLMQGKPVIVVGDPGSGKSGIAAVLARSAANSGKAALLLDARDIAHITSEADLRTYLSLHGPVAAAATRVGRYRDGCRLIVDQWDNCIGLPSAAVLAEVARDCCEADGIEVVVISRNKEAHEVNALTDLINDGFIELTSYALDEETVTWALGELGIDKPSAELIALGRNLLSLSLIGSIKQQRADYDFSTVMGEVDLWEQYVHVLVEREAVGPGIQGAERIAAEAARLAREGLNSADRSVLLSHPLTREQRRLISWEVLLRERGRSFRFRHDQLQDYLYAQDAAARAAMPSTVLDEIDAYRTRGVCQWIDKIYARDDQQLHRLFLEELFDVAP
jgi:hypothetical protein